MPHSLSSKKRMRQNATRRARNRGRKRELKSTLRAFDEAVTAADAGKAAEALKAAVKRLDRTADLGTIHKNAASRKKGRLQRRLNALQKKAAPAT